MRNATTRDIWNGAMREDSEWWEVGWRGREERTKRERTKRAHGQIGRVIIGNRSWEKGSEVSGIQGFKVEAWVVGVLRRSED